MYNYSILNGYQEFSEFRDLNCLLTNKLLVEECQLQAPKKE